MSGIGVFLFKKPFLMHFSKCHKLNVSTIYLRSYLIVIDTFFFLEILEKRISNWHTIGTSYASEENDRDQTNHLVGRRQRVERFNLTYLDRDSNKSKAVDNRNKVNQAYSVYRLTFNFNKHDQANKNMQLIVREIKERVDL